MWNNLYLVILTLSCTRNYEVRSYNSVDLNMGDFGQDRSVLFDGFRRRDHHKPGLRIRNEHQIFITDPKTNLRIRGGNATDTKNYPYMAAIIINGRLWCAGAIVDPNWVVTAAHCLNYVPHQHFRKNWLISPTMKDVQSEVAVKTKEQALDRLVKLGSVLSVSPLKTLGQYVKVRVGSARPHEGGTLVDVAGAVRHPKFEEEPVPHADVALLKLSENLDLHQHVGIIKIYEGIREPFAQSFIVVTGWGATRGTDTSFREHTPDLMTARLKVRSQHYCMDAYQLVNGFQFTPDFFCASLRNGTRDACLFDAGAPAVQQNRLMGVMSFGPERCGHEYQPAVFVKAFYFRDFVKSTISSYKTTGELIEAIQELDNPHPAGQAPVPMYHGIVPEIPESMKSDLQDAWATNTQPDRKHD